MLKYEPCISSMEWKAASIGEWNQCLYVPVDRWKRYNPVDFQIYDIDVDGETKDDHFRDMLAKAKERRFQARIVLFDSWYASVDNLKTVGESGWHWLTRLKIG